MATKFNLTAELNLRGPSNIKNVVAGIRRELKTVVMDVNVRIAKNAETSVNNITNRINSLSAALTTAKVKTDQLNASFGQLASIASSVNRVNAGVSQSAQKSTANMTQSAQATREATNSIQQFGEQSSLAVKRFAAFSLVTTGIFAVGRAVEQGIRAFIEYDQQMVKLEQITGQTKTQLSGLSQEVTRLSTKRHKDSIGSYCRHRSSSKF